MTKPLNPAPTPPAGRKPSGSNSKSGQCSLTLKKEARRKFYHRFLIALGLSGGLLSVSLGLGILGYHCFAGLEWIDSLLNASMILTGMGPVNTLNTNAAKIFASAYALFSGVIFITATGIMLSPIFHHVLHKFHIEDKDLK